RGAQVNGRSTEASTRELELAELGLRPGVRLLFVCRGVTCEQQRTAGAVEVPLELARIGDARVRGDARLEACHRVEGGERRAVAAELELGVADDAVVARRARRDLERLAPELERLCEPMAGERE